jgi:hypothetical protein
MDSLDSRDVVLLAIAGYVALASLVRLMIRHRNAVAIRLRGEVEQERKRQAVVSAIKPKKKPGEAA